MAYPVVKLKPRKQETAGKSHTGGKSRSKALRKRGRMIATFGDDTIAQAVAKVVASGGNASDSCSDTIAQAVAKAVASCGHTSDKSHVHIRLPGEGCRSVKIGDDDTVDFLAGKVASGLGVKRENWDLYTVKSNRAPQALDNKKKINQIDRGQTLYFYPKTVIR